MSILEAIKVFIASPGDLYEERSLFPHILGQLNAIKARSLNYQLDPLGWEDTLPGWGRPQELINEEVRQCDVFVMLLWKRWGTPSGEFSSGTEEEFEIAYNRYKDTGSPHLLLYFRSVPQAMMADPGEQLQRVLKFRTRIEEERIGLFKIYDDPDQWKDLLLKHFSQYLDRKVYGQEYASEAEEKVIQIPYIIERRMLELQKELAEKNALLETTQSKLRAEAIGYALEATKLIEEGKFTLAEEKFAKSVELYEEPEVLKNFGIFLRQIGSLDRARKVFERLLSLSKNNEENMAIAYVNLGNVCMTRSELNKAESMYEKALNINKVLNHKEGTAEAHLGLGNVYITRGNLSEAEQMYEKALEISASIDSKEIMAGACGNLGVVYITRDELDKAETMYKKALEINEALGNKAGIAAAYVNLGVVHITRGKLDKAETMYMKALEISTTLNHKEGMAGVYSGLGIVYKNRRDLIRAKEMQEKALEISTSLGHKEGMADAYINLGIVYRNQDQSDDAEDMYTRALELNKALGRKEGVANVYGNLGSLYKHKGDTDKAKRLWMKAVEFYREIQNYSRAEQLISWIDSIESNDYLEVPTFIRKKAD